MTSSQIKSIVATLAALLALLDAKADLLDALMPPKYAGWLRMGVIAGGLIVAAFNQSLNTNFASVPSEKAQAHGIDPSLHGGKS